MRYGVIDLGSNTIRLAVYHAGQRGLVCLFSKKEFAHAVTYRRQGAMTDEGVRVVSKALCALSRHAALFDLSALWCFATASLRGLVNLPAVLHALAAAAGVSPEVLTAEREAALGVAGFLSAHTVSDALIIDLGGGSCELSLLRDGRTVNAASLPIGSVWAAKRHVLGVLPDGDEAGRIAAVARAALHDADWLPGCGAPVAYAMGGSARAMCRLHHALQTGGDPPGDLSVRDIAALTARLLSRKTGAIRLIDRHCPGRLFTLLPGIIILHQLLRASGAPRLRLCAAGLREGYLLEKLGAL